MDDRGIIPLHKKLFRSFYNAILTELWLEVIHDTELLQIGVAAVHKNVAR